MLKCIDNGPKIHLSLEKWKKWVWKEKELIEFYTCCISEAKEW
jgi:hypothetical protein